MGLYKSTGILIFLIAISFIVTGCKKGSSDIPKKEKKQTTQSSILEKKRQVITNKSGEIEKADKSRSFLPKQKIDKENRNISPEKSAHATSEKQPSSIPQKQKTPEEEQATEPTPEELQAASQPYDIELSALQDSQGTTELILTMQTLQDLEATDFADRLVLRLLNDQKRVVETRTYVDLKLQQSKELDTSTLKLMIEKTKYFQSVQATIYLWDKASSKETSYMGEAKALLRPDPAIEKILVPEATVGQVVNIAASLSERNGDLGVLSHLVLKQGEKIVDGFPQLFLLPNQNVTILFSLTFEQQGIHDLSLEIQHPSPKDFDQENNKKSFTVTVSASSPTLAYNTEFWYRQEKREYFGAKPAHEQEQSIYFQSVRNIPGLFQYPVESMNFQVIQDGLEEEYSIPNLFVTKVLQKSGTFYLNLTKNLGNGFILYIQGIKNIHGKRAPISHVMIWQATNEKIFFSKNHEIIWGNNFGSIFNKPPYPKEHLETRFLLRDNPKEYVGEVNLYLQSEILNEKSDYLKRQGVDRKGKRSGYFE